MRREAGCRTDTPDTLTVAVRFEWRFEQRRGPVRPECFARSGPQRNSFLPRRNILYLTWSCRAAEQPNSISTEGERREGDDESVRCEGGVSGANVDAFVFGLMLGVWVVLLNFACLLYVNIYLGGHGAECSLQVDIATSVSLWPEHSLRVLEQQPCPLLPTTWPNTTSQVRAITAREMATGIYDISNVL